MDLKFIECHISVIVYVDTLDNLLEVTLFNFDAFFLKISHLAFGKAGLYFVCFDLSIIINVHDSECLLEILFVQYLGAIRGCCEKLLVADLAILVRVAFFNDFLPVELFAKCLLMVFSEFLHSCLYLFFLKESVLIRVSSCENPSQRS